MQKKRLFIAIPLTASVARSVKRISAEIEERFSAFDGTDQQIRFTLQGNWHLTVTFLGDQDDIMLPAIADAVKIVSRKFVAPEIVFEKIDYGPGRNVPPRMIWLCADRASSGRIAKIRDFLEDALTSRGVPFQREMRLFSGHITLARFGEEADLSSLPKIERPLQFSDIA